MTRVSHARADFGWMFGQVSAARDNGAAGQVSRMELH